MKIKMYGMTPDGEIVRDSAEVFEGSDAQEIVQAMMAATPMANGQPEAVYMRDVLARIGQPGYKLPTEPIAACWSFLGLLQDRGLAESIGPLTPLRIKLIGEDGNIFNLLGIALRALRDGGRGDLCKPLTEAVTSSKSYEEALCRIAEYVEVE